MESNISSGPPNLTGLKLQVAEHETRTVENDRPLHWLRRNWITVASIVAGNAAISALLFHLLR